MMQMVRAVLLLLVAATATEAFFSFTPTVKMATFNAALIPPFPQLEERRDILIEQIIGSDIDILCLQEVWQTNSQRIIYNAVSKAYPYAVSAIDLTQTNTSSEPACSPEVVQEFAQCVAEFCSRNPSLGLLVCPFIGCGSMLVNLSLGCRGCLSLNGPSAACTTEPAATYDTTYGLLLLSKRRFSSTSVERYFPQSEFRGFIRASVENVGEILCTHSQSDLGPVYFGPPFGEPFLFSTYAEQQYNELLRLFDFVTSSQFPILIGDFNHGPAGPGNLTWEFPFNYGAVIARGLTSPYVLMDGRCTFCTSNPGVSFPASILIDHVYIPATAIDRVVSTKRIWDTIFTSLGVPLSDHYGVELVLREARRCVWRRWRYVCEDVSEELDYLPLPPPNQRLADLCQAVV